MPQPYLAELSRHVARPPHDVWAALEDTSAYRRWWPWLHTFESDGGLVAGSTWRAAIRAPLPYTVEFVVDLTDVDPDARTLRAGVRGDIDGEATVALLANDQGTLLQTSWQLVPVRPLLKLLDAGARPLARWGHDTVMQRSVDAFVRAVEEPPRPPS